MDRLEILADADDGAIAAWLEARIAAALAAQTGPVALCLPGGSTPFPILERLVRAPLDWSRVEVWPGDDRCVPMDHPASNAGRLAALLEPPGARVVPLAEDARPPRFALTWLGMGTDGHIASLFPNTDPRADDALPLRRLVPDPLPPEAPFARLSLTIPALLDADGLLFVIRGADKRALFEAAARGENDLPVARLLAAAQVPVTCFA
ncbi:MAG TPA: 6-phosphogluconolactonase [Novosphingobium sp.]|nr:6-phosphogluconolactonase [Novosphingobium sp.]